MSLDALRATLVPPPRRRWPWLAAAALVAAAAGWLTLAPGVWARRTAPGVASRSETPGTRLPTAAPPRPTVSTTTTTTAPPVRVWPTTTPARPALVVASAGGRFSVGADGDLTAVGRFRCGAPVLALARPDGDVFLFAGWATAAADVVAAPLGHVDGPRALRVTDNDGDGCDELVVERSSGPPVTLRP